MALDLIDFDELKALLGFGKGESDYPALETLEKRVTAAVQSYMRRELEQKERTEEIMMVEPSSMLSLKALPVSSVSSVSLNYFGDVTTYSADERMAVSYGLLMSLSIGPGVVTVVYTGGYRNNAIPDGIRQAATIQLAYEYQNKDHIGAETVSTEGGTKSTPPLQLLREVKRMLDSHRHPLRVNV